MLVLSFYTNHAEALHTARAYAEAVRGADTAGDWVLGLEVAAQRSGVLPPDQSPVAEVLAAFQTQGWPEVWAWTDDATDLVRHELRAPWPEPLHRGFSYGGAVNRFLLLARLARCEYLARVDPGCGAPPDLGAVLRRHLEPLASGASVVASGQYGDPQAADGAGRNALRAEFIAPNQRPEFYDLVSEFTRIDPRNQVVGGALCCLRAAGPPAIQFDGVRVWSSDDGIWAHTFPGRATLMPESKIPRGAPGFSMPLNEYLARVTHAVVLRELRDHSERDRAVQRADAFLARVEGLLAPSRHSDFSLAETRARVLAGVDSIVAGIAAYPALVQSWPQIVAAAGQLEPLRARCRVV
jgi:hypothetical protein